MCDLGPIPIVSLIKHALTLSAVWIEHKTLFLISRKRGILCFLESLVSTFQRNVAGALPRLSRFIVKGRKQDMNSHAGVVLHMNVLSLSGSVK